MIPRINSLQKEYPYAINLIKGESKISLLYSRFCHYTNNAKNLGLTLKMIGTVNENLLAGPSLIKALTNDVEEDGHSLIQNLINNGELRFKIKGDEVIWHQH